MKTIRIAYAGFDSNDEQSMRNRKQTKLLEKHFNVEIDTKNPEYLFCTDNILEAIKYDCVRIEIIGENVFPDFNIFDYAIGLNYIDFGDRYIRYPFYLNEKELVELALKKHTYDDEYYLSKKKFCNFIVSNGNHANHVREHFFERLNEYKHVDSAGRYMNNMPNGETVGDKLAFQKQYRYSIAFENSMAAGYTTEKILHAYAASTIPIYWGDPEVLKDFNEKSMIRIADEADFDKAIKLIDELEKDESKYLSYMKEPMLCANSKIPVMNQEDYLEEFLVNICSKDYKDAIKRTGHLCSVYEDNHRFRLKNSFMFGLWKKIEAFNKE